MLPNVAVSIGSGRGDFEKLCKVRARPASMLFVCMVLRMPCTPSAPCLVELVLAILPRRWSICVALFCCVFCHVSCLVYDPTARLSV
mgnify:CR=1 FL=1